MLTDEMFVRVRAVSARAILTIFGNLNPVIGHSFANPLHPSIQLKLATSTNVPDLRPAKGSGLSTDDPDAVGSVRQRRVSHSKGEPVIEPRCRLVRLNVCYCGEKKSVGSRCCICSARYIAELTPDRDSPIFRLR